MEITMPKTLINKELNLKSLDETLKKHSSETMFVNLISKNNSYNEIHNKILFIEVEEKAISSSVESSSQQELLSQIETQEESHSHTFIWKGEQISYNTMENHKESYKIESLIAKGSYNQVFEALDENSNSKVAIKISHRNNDILNAVINEIQIMRKICGIGHNNSSHIVQMLDYFFYKGSLCVVYEKLDVSILEMLEMIGYNGFSFQDISEITSQLIKGLSFAKEQGIVHNDLRPENILFVKKNCMEVKIIDWVMANDLNNEVNFNIQSRFYKAPELLLKYSFTDISQIDVWSLGCVIAELFIGLPVFPGSSDYDQISKIIGLLGNPEQHYLSRCNSTEFIKLEGNEKMLKTHSEYENDMNEAIPEPREFYQLEDFHDFESLYNISEFRNTEDLDKMPEFLEILQETLKINPLERATLDELSSLQFITNISEEILYSSKLEDSKYKWQQREEETKTNCSSKQSSKEFIEVDDPLNFEVSTEKEQNLL